MYPPARPLIVSRPTVVVTLSVAFVLVLGAAALSTFSLREILQGDRRAAHAQEALGLTHQLLATIVEAETAQRGYLLSGDDKYLGHYQTSLPRYRADIAALQRSLAADPQQAALVAPLPALIDRRFAELARAIQLRRNEGTAAGAALIEDAAAWRAMEEIRARLRAVQRQQLAAISSHAVTAAQQARFFQWLNGAILGVAAILAGTVGWLVIRRLSQLEGLIKICAWTQRVEWHGQWITFEEYLDKQFNLQVTHGISDEAARQLELDIENTPVPPDQEELF